jgi:hypothetical protein
MIPPLARRPRAGLRILSIATMAGLLTAATMAGAEDAPAAAPEAAAPEVEAVAPAASVDSIVNAQVRENDDSAASQDRVDDMASDIDSMTTKYRAALANVDQLGVYNRQLETLIDGQEEEMASLRRQIDEVTVIGRQVMPHMERMIDTLAKFVELDLPFLLQERRARVQDLRDIMTRADITISERYRRIMEAYQIENEYGRTIEAYQGTLDRNGSSRTVDFLRVGRNALLYQTLDGLESGVWDARGGRWDDAGDYRNEITDGLRMARKQRAPDLVEVPMPAAEVLR